MLERCMVDLESAKDFINKIRLYMTMCLALIISIGSGVSKMYVAQDFNYIFFVAYIYIFSKKIRSKNR